MKADFTTNLIKGKIAEIVFDQMFREEQRFTIIPFGYETIMPELIQYTQWNERKGLFESISNAPDYALVTHDPKQVMLIEVKFRTNAVMKDIKEMAELICLRWKLAWLFLATPQGFYFDKCNDIAHKSSLTPLDPRMVPIELQKKYLKILNEFINKGQVET